MLSTVLIILFVATLVRSAFGFGEALVAVPLLAFIMPVDQAAPIAVLVSITVAVVAIIQDWRHIQLRSAMRLVAATAVGTPIGLWALRDLDGPWMKMALGVVVPAFSGFSLLGRPRQSLGNDRRAWAFGLGAGVLGGAYGMNGPPLVAYGALRGWSPRQFRATLQGYFLPASLMAAVGYAWAGLWTPAVTHRYLQALPVLALAIPLGRWINRRLSAEVFVRCVHVGLLGVGLLLMSQSLGWLDR